MAIGNGIGNDFLNIVRPGKIVTDFHGAVFHPFRPVDSRKDAVSHVPAGAKVIADDGQVRWQVVPVFLNHLHQQGKLPVFGQFNVVL